MNLIKFREYWHIELTVDGSLLTQLNNKKLVFHLEDDFLTERQNVF